MPAETASAGVFTFRPIERPVDGTVVIPGSKSNHQPGLAHRRAGPRQRANRALFSDDTRYMAEALNQLGIRVEATNQPLRFSMTGATAPFRRRLPICHR